MDEIREIFKSNHILYNTEINRLLEIIFEMFNIPGHPHLKIDNRLSWGMAFFKEEPYNFYLNWHKLAENFKNKSVKEANYWLFFYCLHEVMHHRQLISGITSDEMVLFIMNKSYLYVEETKKAKVTEVFHRTMYRMFHDYFPLEINADVLAYIKLLEILRQIDWEFFEIFLGYFKKRIEKIYEGEILRDIYTVLLDLDVNLDDYSLEEKIIYGMPIDKKLVKSVDVVQLIK